MTSKQEIAQYVSDNVIQAALNDKKPEELLSVLCDSLHEKGFPILRGHIATTWLHPMSAATSSTWRRGAGVTDRDRHSHGSENSQPWQVSPLKAMLDDQKTEYRIRMCEGQGLNRFPIVKEYYDQGATEYYAIAVPYGGELTSLSINQGSIMSFLTDQEEGFSETDLDILRRVVPRFVLGFKSAIHKETTDNIVTAYLGHSATEQVLSGQIKRGDGEFINAILWYSDLRNSSDLASRLEPKEFIDLLNHYFECSAGAVLDHGGEVLRFVGDAVLAIFPVEGATGEARASRMAMSAMKSAYMHMKEYNEDPDNKERIDFGLGLHRGEVLYGNIGVPERLEFSVIGRAANEVARMEDYSKEAGQSVVASAEFKNLTQGHDWNDKGLVEFKGVGRAMHVYTLTP